MKYVFDTDTISNIFKFYYHDRFPTFWKRFDSLVSNSEVKSTREVKRELENWGVNWPKIKKWVSDFPDFFITPSEDELKFVTVIYGTKHFQNNISTQKRLRGGPFADPFVIALAKVKNATVVTQESFKENAAKIPNICAHFGIKCTNLEGFLTKENWEF